MRVLSWHRWRRVQGANLARLALRQRRQTRPCSSQNRGITGTGMPETDECA
jgi:hypothetical protein